MELEIINSGGGWGDAWAAPQPGSCLYAKESRLQEGKAVLFANCGL